MTKNNTKPVIITGFTLILIIFMTLAGVWVTTQQYQHDRLVKIDTLRQAATSIGNMRQAALKRSVLLHEMSLHEDYFDRNDVYEQFSEEAGYFIQARDRLLALDLTAKDRQLWQGLKDLIVENSATQGIVSRMLLEGERVQGSELMLEEILPKQQEIMTRLSGIFDYHNAQVASEFNAAELEQTNAYKIVWMLAGLALFVSVGIIIYIVSTTVRIQKDLLRADEARVANQMKSDFLANMSHEIRTPLTSIIGYSDAALSPGQTREQRMDGIRTIRRNGHHLLKLINEILDLSKVEAGKLDLEINKVAVIDVLEDVSDVVSIKAREKGLEWGINYRYPLPVKIDSDAVRLQQILLNLVNNAMKFTNEGHVYLNVWCDSHSRRMYFEVVDTGIGIPEAKQNSVFDAFTQADKSTTREYGGTGLGLTLSRRLTRMLGGDITVESTPGIGSRFLISVDTGALDQKDLIHQSNSQQRRKENLANEMPVLEGKVLLVDDIEDNQRLISMFVRNTGAQVDVASDGKQAVEMVQFGQYDLILMDMQMPVMDGVEATRTLRARGIETPIVMLTANAYASDQRRCEQAGANAFLTKPINNFELNAVLDKYLQDCVRIGGMTSTLLSEEPELQDIVNRFVRFLPQQIEHIANLMQAKEWKDLELALHSLKGTSGNMGFPEIFDCVLAMESSLRREVYSDLDIHLKLLEKLCGIADGNVAIA